MAAAVLVTGAAVAALVAGWVPTSWTGGAPPAPAAAACPGPDSHLAAAPELADEVASLLREAGCTSVSVEAAAPEVVATAVSRGDAPDWWIPDSALWATGSRLAEVVPSLASSPVVVATAGDRGAADRGAGNWAAVVAADDFVPGDPAVDSAAALAVTLGAGSSPGAEAVELLAPLAQRSLDAGAVTAAERLALVAGGGGSTAASEQLVLRDHPSLALSVPGGQTAVLDYPLLGQVGADAVTRALLADVLTSADAQQRYQRLGFRTDAADPEPEGGAGALREVAVPTARVQAVRSQWALFASPSRALAVMDVSGSMAFDTAAGTRADLALAAARDGLGLFPDGAEIGLWAFSERLVGEQDHRVVTPMAALDAPTAAGTQRDSLLAGLASLPDQVGGGTGLNDTVLAAYRTLARDYRDGAFHSLLLFTDGSNDDPGSIGDRALLQRLRTLYRTTPIRVVAIGISADADDEALAAIARATDGVSYVATQPEDVRNVFVAALGGRTG